MKSRDSRARLDRLVAELRAQPPPAPPNELPSRLRAEFRRVNAAGWPAAFGTAAVGTAQAGTGMAPSSAASRSRAAGAAWLPRLVAVSALALGAALVVGRFSGTPAPRPALPGPTAVAPASVARWAIALLDGEPLALGEPVIALDQPRRVEHPGRASWVLAPGSRGRALSTASGVLRIALERGSLDAEVLPFRGAAAQTQTPAESFIVEAQGTEVAVHGTRFRVTLSGERTEVAVSQGQVVVRPLGQRAGTLLDAGMSAGFRAGVVARVVPAAPATSSTGSARAVTAQPLAAQRPERAAPASTPGVSAAPTAGAPRSPPAPAPSSSQAHTPSAAVVESALRAITERVQGCFRRHTSGPSELGIELSTELGFSVEPNGELLQADFEPPLAPAVEACVAAELEQLRLAPSPEGYRVRREIRLRR